MYKNRATPNGNVKFAVAGATRLNLRKLASLTGSVAKEGWSTEQDLRNFCELAEAILFDWKGEPDDVQEAIYPTPESVRAETEES